MPEEDLLSKIQKLIVEWEESNNNNRIVECSIAFGKDFEPLYVYNGDIFVPCTREDE